MHKGSNPIFYNEKWIYHWHWTYIRERSIYILHPKPNMFIYHINKHVLRLFSLLLLDLLLCFVAVSEYHGCRLSVTATAGGQGLPMLAVSISSKKNKCSILICGVSPRWWLFTTHLKMQKKSQIGNHFPKSQGKKQKWNHHLEANWKIYANGPNNYFMFAMFL